jgi:putative lipoprotein
VEFKKVLNFLSIFMAAFVLYGCAAKAKFDVPQIVNFDKREFEVASQSGSNLLYISHEKEDFYFTMINSMGTPLARRVLRPSGEFEAIGFLPPNSTYNELFVKVLNIVKSNQKEAVITANNENFKVRALDIR